MPFSSPQVSLTGPTPLVLWGTDPDLPPPSWPTALSWVLRVPPRNGSLSLSPGGFPALRLNDSWGLGQALWYVLDPAVASLGCTPHFSDGFEVQLFDGELFEQPRRFELKGMACGLCPVPQVWMCLGWGKVVYVFICLLIGSGSRFE